jgi:hypothetical protein
VRRLGMSVVGVRRRKTLTVNMETATLIGKGVYTVFRKSQCTFTMLLYRFRSISVFTDITANTFYKFTATFRTHGRI